MTKRFLKCISIILQHEGGYVNHPNDPGGETNFGISKRSYPKLDIKNLSKDQASEIYYKDFWTKLRCDELQSELLALHVFDMGVNAGTGRAAKILQRILLIKDDGVIGPITVRFANNFIDQKKLVSFYIEKRIEYYNKIAKANIKLQVFLKGWLKRVKSTKFN